jgi:uncharacterized protein (UPF0332 family)
MSTDDAESYLRRAQESLAGAESECAALRFNNCTNRAYYAAFQAAIAALLRDDIRSRSRDRWPHEFVQAEFAGKLINRRRRYLPALRSTLPFLQVLRNRADYETDETSETEATRALRRSRDFVDAIRAGGN